MNISSNSADMQMCVYSMQVIAGRDIASTAEHGPLVGGDYGKPR